jgi:HD-GYP domain-containing protein (c-di-GMP phosphodiesterase class II)
LKGEELSLQSRILAVADFYEVLSKKYRSHVTPTPFEVIVSVLERAAESGAFDSDIIDLLLRDKVHEKFEKAYEDLVRTSDDG